MRLASDDNDAIGFLFHFKQVFAFKQSAIDGLALAALFGEKRGQFFLYYVDSEQGTHRGLNDFWIPHFHAIRAAYNVVDAEPLRCADEGAHVTRIGDAVQGENEARVCGKLLFYRCFHHGKDTWRRILTTHLGHLYLADCFGLWKSFMPSCCSIECCGREVRVE